MTDRSNRGESQVGTASIEAIVGNKLFMMMKKDADEAKKKKKKKYLDESDSDDDDIPPFIKNKDRSEPKFVPFGKGAQALFDLKFKNGSLNIPRKVPFVRDDCFILNFRFEMTVLVSYQKDTIRSLRLTSITVMEKCKSHCE